MGKQGSLKAMSVGSNPTSPAKYIINNKNLIYCKKYDIIIIESKKRKLSNKGLVSKYQMHWEPEQPVRVRLRVAYSEWVSRSKTSLAIWVSTSIGRDGGQRECRGGN